MYPVKIYWQLIQHVMSYQNFYKPIQELQSVQKDWLMLFEQSPPPMWKLNIMLSMNFHWIFFLWKFWLIDIDGTFCPYLGKVKNLFKNLVLLSILKGLHSDQNQHHLKQNSQEKGNRSRQIGIWIIMGDCNEIWKRYELPH